MIDQVLWLWCSPSGITIVIKWFTCWLNCRSVWYIPGAVGWVISLVGVMTITMAVIRQSSVLSWKLPQCWDWPLVLIHESFWLGGLWICCLYVWSCLESLLLSLLPVDTDWPWPYSELCFWWSQFNMSYRMSGRCFSNVGVNLSHSKYIGIIYTLYLIPILIMSPFTLASNLHVPSWFGLDPQS